MNLPDGNGVEPGILPVKVATLSNGPVDFLESPVSTKKLAVNT